MHFISLRGLPKLANFDSPSVPIIEVVILTMIYTSSLPQAPWKAEMGHFLLGVFAYETENVPFIAILSPSPNFTEIVSIVSSFGRTFCRSLLFIEAPNMKF